MRNCVLRIFVLMLIAALTLLLNGCGYWAVENERIQVGPDVIRVTPIPESTNEP